MPVEIYLLPPIGTLIGWLTNRIAIRLLFHPHYPRRLPLLGWELQGLLPKRRADLARTVGKTVERELLSTGDLVQHLAQPRFRGELTGSLAAVAAQRFDSRVPAFVPRQLRDLLSGIVQEFMRREMEAVFDQILTRVRDHLETELSIGALIESRLLEIELADLETLILQVAGRELAHIEILGGILGFVIGLLQSAVFLITAPS